MITTECRQAENAFWGDPHNIAWFRDEKVPPYWDKFFREASKTEVSRVLDLGCGAGRVSDMLANYGYDLYACDFNAGMAAETVKRLKNTHPEIDWTTRVSQASMLELPYPREYFDAVVSNGVYHNAWSREDLEKALRETAGVLRPQRYLCFNLFTSGFVSPDLRPAEDIRGLYVTVEGLRMTLVSKNDFLLMAESHGLKPTKEITEYLREVTTGKRFVMRGVLVKN